MTSVFYRKPMLMYNFNIGGDGRLGIHGTNNPSGIGRRISHGCIRVRNPVIRRMARVLPLGTPVHIRRRRA